MPIEYELNDHDRRTAEAIRAALEAHRDALNETGAPPMYRDGGPAAAHFSA